MEVHLVSTCICSGKTCSQCGVTQCIEGFHRQKRSADGRRAECKICRKAERETEEFKAKRRAYHKEHAKQINETKRAWYHANPERVSQQARNSRLLHSEKARDCARKYNHSERGKQRFREYRDRHPERVQRSSEEWKASHPKIAQEYAKVRSANYKAKKLGIPGKITTQQWRELKVRYNNTCLRCGRQEPLITLTIDHVIPFFFQGANDITNTQPLCEFCNTSKGTKIIDYRLTFEEEDCG